ncbi:hypothetical protein ACLE20_05385 [Rhizobium sp. YIM 134829]|uniref:hypothetical protein n=1 Tax=Rhizobium sp. YIM 134829 TaxID=3390453 RepID=UPI00397C0D39
MTTFEPDLAAAPASAWQARLARLAGIWPLALIGWTIVALGGLRATAGLSDYVGTDNDDVMRLVEVRDWLAGQSWFDLVQPRLGLEGGTLMHWSRFVDLPIGLLIRFFDLFLSSEAAEAAALTAWPLLLILPVLLAIGRACRSIGGQPVMLAGFVLGTLSLLSNPRFQPGNIDHHNVQILLVTLMVMGLVERGRPVLGHAVTGLAAGLAIAVGAETTPLVAVVCAIVACRWAVHGARLRDEATAFGLTLAITVSAAFFATTPPHLYSTVTCDNLSLGFFTLATAGGSLLALCSLTVSAKSARIRLGALALAAVGLAALAVAVAPQCLQSPLATLDPLLKSLWLSHVEEAQSILAIAETRPSFLGFGYGVGLLGTLICLLRAWRGERRELHLIFLALVLSALLIGMVQARGTVFASLLALYPLALAIIDLRRHAHGPPRRASAELAFALLVLLSIPSVWGLGTIGLMTVTGKETELTGARSAGACTGRDAMAPLAAEPTGVVAGPSNLGASILRFTAHRALSGPYHRNQQGLLAGLRAGMEPPPAAARLLQESGATLLAFCPSDGEVALLSSTYPDGLYAALLRGEVPAYLTPVNGSRDAPLRLYRVAAGR